MLKELSKTEKAPADIARAEEIPDYVPEIVDGVMRSRKSTRAFLPRPVRADDVRDILEVAARAPSGTNIQPWKAYWVDKEGIDRVYDAILNCGIKPERAEWTDYKYYPDKFEEPFLTRRRNLGKALYGLLGISKRDIPAMRRQFNRNYNFFDAPVGIFVTIDRTLAVGSWLDLGMFMQNVFLAAQARGISTCPIAAFAPYHQQIRPVVGIPDQEIVVCGIALGYPDPSMPENALQTRRAPLDEWVKFPAGQASQARRPDQASRTDITQEFDR